MKAMKAWLSKHGTMKHRSIHGVKTGGHDNPHVMKAAHRASGGRCGDVEGGAAKMRLDRPGRKLGGKVGNNPNMPNAMKHLDGDPGKPASSSDASRVKMGMPKRDGSDKAAGGKVCRAKGGMIPYETNRGTDEGGWSKGDATKHADGKDFSKGGKACRADGGSVMQKDWKSGDGTERPSGSKFAKGGKVNWIAGAVGKNPGALHKALKVPMGEKIPEKKLEKAEDSDNPKMRKRAMLAETLKGMKK